MAIVINPSTVGFRQKADALLKKELAGLNPQVRLGVDSAGVNKSLADLQARIKVLSGKLTNLRLGADTKDAEAKITALQARLLGLTRQIASIVASVDTTKIDAAIARELAQVGRLKQQLSKLQMDADSTRALSKIANLEAEAFHLQENLSKMTADVDISKAEARLRAIDAELRVLNSSARTIQLKADRSDLRASIIVSEAEVDRLRAKAADIRIGASIDTARLLTADSDLLKLEAALAKLTPAAATGGLALATITTAITGGGTGWGVLTNRIKLFGGLLNRILPDALRSVSVWHAIADAIFEVGAVVLPAALAFTAFGIAASDAAKEIQNRLQAAHTVLDATGRSIPQLASGMEQLHKAVQPQVYQLFGDALTIMHSKTGLFATVAKGTATVVDQLAARFTYAATTGGGFSKFMNKSVQDASQLGTLVGNVGGIIGNLFKNVPGYAGMLLGLAVGFTQAAEAATRILEPVTRWILVLHGAIVYSGLFVTGTLAMIGGLTTLARSFITFSAGAVMSGVNALRAFTGMLLTVALELVTYVGGIIAAEGATATFGAALAPLAANPLIGIAAAVVVLGALVIWLGRAKDHAQQFNDTMQHTITTAQISSLASTIQSAQAQTTVKLAQANTTLNQALAEQGVRTGQASRSWGNETAAVYNAHKAVNELTGAHVQLDAQAQLVNGRIGILSKQYGGNAQALGALNAAGITSEQLLKTGGQAWAEIKIQVASTLTAYSAMGTQSGVLGNDLDVLGRTMTSQYQSIQKLNQGWSTFITEVTGTQGSFDTVAQGFATLKDHSGTLRLSLGKLRVSYKDANAAIDSLTPAGLALNQAFGDQVVNIDKMFASWRTAGLAGNLFSQGVAAAIAPMEKYAAGSQEATAQLVALAGQAGYQGPISLQAMNKYLGISQKMLGDTAGSTQKVKDAANQATVQEALLTGAMQAQGNLISGQLLGDINNAILAYSGVKKAVTDYGTAVAQSGKNSSDAQAKMVTAIGAIVKAEVGMGDNASQMAAIVAKTFGISMPDAISKVKSAMGDLADKALPHAQGQFITFAEVGLHKTRDQAHDLWNEIATKLGPHLDSLGDLAGGKAKAKFIDWAQNGLHKSKSEATFLWQELVKLQDHIDNLHGKNVGVNFVGSGTGSISFKESIPGVTTGPSSTGILGFHAAGGFISGGTPWKDSVMAMLMPGEVVVPTGMVKAGAVDHLRGRLPGFAAGGLAGSTGSAKFTGLTGPGGVLTAGQPYMGKTEAAFGQAVEAAFAKAVIAKFKRDMNSLGGSGSAIVSYARSFLGQIPYVFGGNSLSGGIDCSGFTQAVYGKFGIHAPRTSESQYAWATKSGPVPGGLAFYVSPAGGPPPGHVAIVQNGNSVISQGGGMGPKIEALNFMPLMGTGVPKGGLPSGGTGGPGNQAIGGGALQAIAMSLLRQYGWASQWNSFNALENSEAGWRMNARNPGSGAYGLAQFINGPSEYFQYGGDPNTGLGQLTAMMNYISHRYPSGPDEAWAFHLRNNYYGKGGQIPGMAAGGSLGAKRAGSHAARAPAGAIAQQGAAYLKAWQTRHGGGFGAAWGPVPVNPQIDAMNAAAHRDTTLAGARGLTGSQHKHYQALAVLDKRRVNALLHERDTERSWRTQLGSDAAQRQSWITAAGGNPSLAKNVASWKAGEGWDKWMIGNISGMLGLSAAQVAAAQKAGTLGPGGKPLPAVTHTYGTVTDVIEAYLQSHAAPFGAARGGMIPAHSYDQGGHLPPGLSMAWNGTGKPEPVGGGGCVTVEAHLHVHGPVGSQAELENWLVGSVNKAAQLGRLKSAFTMSNSARHSHPSPGGFGR